MRFSLEMSARGFAAEAEATVAVAQAAERAGFAYLAYTEHPAPDQKWRESSVGHATYDPFAALAFVAAVTTRVRLMTYIAVLPFRNPLLLAKTIATVDRLCGGRLTISTGAGYLRSEFAALGVDYSERAARYDESLDVLRTVFEGPFSLHGKGFDAAEVVIDPPPIQRPHPPIWIGGSSPASLRRVIRVGSGWAPGLDVAGMSQAASGTTALASLDEVATAVAGLHGKLEAVGRDPADVAIQLDFLIGMGQPADQILERITGAEQAGVTHLLVRPRGRSLDEMTAAVQTFGTEVIDQCTPADARSGRC